MTSSTWSSNIWTTHGGPPQPYCAIHFFPPIKPTLMGQIVSMFTYFNEGPSMNPM